MIFNNNHQNCGQVNKWPFFVIKLLTSVPYNQEIARLDCALASGTSLWLLDLLVSSLATHWTFWLLDLRSTTGSSLAFSWIDCRFSQPFMGFIGYFLAIFLIYFLSMNIRYPHISVPSLNWTYRFPTLPFPLKARCSSYHSSFRSFLWLIVFFNLSCCAILSFILSCCAILFFFYFIVLCYF